MTTNVMEKPAKTAMNGVDVPTLLATIGAVKGARELAKFTFRAKGNWVNGTHSRVGVKDYFGAGGEQQRTQTLTVDAAHTTVLCGTDKGPTPPELLLMALSACITAGIGNIASARQIEINSIEAHVEGDIDVQGILGLDDQVRNGFNDIRATFAISGNASDEQLRAIVEQSIARSAVYDMLTNGAPVNIMTTIA